MSWGYGSSLQCVWGSEIKNKTNSTLQVEVQLKQIIEVESQWKWDILWFEESVILPVVYNWFQGSSGDHKGVQGCPWKYWEKLYKMLFYGSHNNEMWYYYYYLFIFTTTNLIILLVHSAFKRLLRNHEINCCYYLTAFSN